VFDDAALPTDRLGVTALHEGMAKSVIDRHRFIIDAFALLFNHYRYCWSSDLEPAKSDGRVN